MVFRRRFPCHRFFPFRSFVFEKSFYVCGRQRINGLFSIIYAILDNLNSFLNNGEICTEWIGRGFESDTFDIDKNLFDVR